MLVNSFTKIWNRLIISKKNNKISRAYLVYTDDSSYESKIIKNMSKMILCKSQDNDKLYCDRCSNCIALENNYEDIITILQPSSISNTILIGSDSNSENTMRWFQNKLCISSISHNKKIGMILKADKMQTMTQNAFLKTLEEPPNDCHLILVTNKYSKLLPTILSRCTLLRFITNHHIELVKPEYKHEMLNILFNREENNNQIKLILEVKRLMTQICHVIQRDEDDKNKKQENKNIYKTTMIKCINVIYNWMSDLFLHKKIDKNLAHKFTNYIKVIDKTYSDTLLHWDMITNKELLLLEFSKNLIEKKYE